MTNDENLKVVKINEDDCVNYSVKEILQEALDDLEKGMPADRVIVLTNKSDYFGGFKTNDEVLGFLTRKVAKEIDGS